MSSGKTERAPLVVGIGELTWDLLPGGKQLGGAPSNFAYISSLFGNRGIIVSAVGDDELGREAIAYCDQLGLDTNYIQVDDDHPSSTVQVSLDEHGQPSFEIAKQIAWDFLTWNKDLEQLARQVDVICFGSLAQRNQVSRDTTERFLRASREGCLRIFDTNLRQAFFSPTVLKTGFALATVAKLNNNELPVVLQTLGLPATDDPVTDCRLLLEQFGLELVCLTRGAHGSWLVTRDGASEHPGFRVGVIDTVGSGDAFAAAMAHQLRKGASLDVINEFANRVASWVASRPGATPVPSEHDLLHFAASF
ncbi:MAG TPA: carbohydrate kinase [Terriglobales bacterium]|nr:carbohydrate kinase [Terriglobales bacterium]